MGALLTAYYIPLQHTGLTRTCVTNVTKLRVDFDLEGFVLPGLTYTTQARRPDTGLYRGILIPAKMCVSAVDSYDSFGVAALVTFNFSSQGQFQLQTPS